MPNNQHYKTARHKRWRAAVLRAAGYLCEECKRYGRKTPATYAHHVKPLELFPESAYNIGNGRALCDACHNKAHPEKAAKARRARR